MSFNIFLSEIRKIRATFDAGLMVSATLSEMVGDVLAQMDQSEEEEYDWTYTKDEDCICEDYAERVREDLDAVRASPACSATHRMIALLVEAGEAVELY